LAKQEIMRGRTEKIAKIEWWDSVSGCSPLYPVFWVSFFSGGVVSYRWVPYGFEGFAKIPKLTWVFVVIAVLVISCSNCNTRLLTCWKARKNTNDAGRREELE
jgi:hypothetical protein